MSPRWLHWPAAAAQVADILIATGPGGNGTVNGQTVANGTRFEFSSGSIAYDTWGIIAFGILAVGNGYMHFQFYDDTTRAAFKSAYPWPGSSASIFRVSTDGTFGSNQDIGFTGGVSDYTSDPYGIRYNACAISLSSLISDLASGSGFTMTIDNAP
jgi:hypothetical protein